MRLKSTRSMRNACVLMSAICWSFAYGQTPGWQAVAASADRENYYEAKEGSYETTRNKGGDEIAVVIGRHESKSKSSVNVQKWYVKTSDCKAKQGKIVTLSIDGSFLYESDFVHGAGNIASGKAEFICDVYEHFAEIKRKKGI